MNLTYDLGWGADRDDNDAGMRTPIDQSISGIVFQDASGKMTDLADTDYNGKRDEGEPGIANKKVILKQWYLTEDGWKQNMSFGNEKYTAAETIPGVTDATPGDGAAPAEAPHASRKVIPGSTYDATLGGVWVTTADGIKADAAGVVTEAGRYLFAKLPTRYSAKHDGATPGRQYLAGYTVELAGGNGETDMQGLPATLL